MFNDCIYQIHNDIGNNYDFCSCADGKTINQFYCQYGSRERACKECKFYKSPNILGKQIEDVKNAIIESFERFRKGLPR